MKEGGGGGTSRERAASLLSVSHGQTDCPQAPVHHLPPHYLYGLITQLIAAQCWTWTKMHMSKVSRSERNWHTFAWKPRIITNSASKNHPNLSVILFFCVLHQHRLWAAVAFFAYWSPLNTKCSCFVSFVGEHEITSRIIKTKEKSRQVRDEVVKKFKAGLGFKKQALHI